MLASLRLIKPLSSAPSGSSRTSWNHSRDRDDRERGGLDRGVERGMRERRYSGRSRQDSWHEDGAEEMPEWTMDDPFDGDIGTFDSSGAFCSTKVRYLMNLIF